MPTVEELGKKVKSKYAGVYDDLNDRDLGVRVKSKFPGSYDDFEDTALNVTAPTVKPVSTPAKDFARAISAPGVTSAEKTTWEKAKEFTEKPLITALPADMGATPYNRAVEARLRAVTGNKVDKEALQSMPLPDKRVGDVLDERGGGPVEGAMRGFGRVASGLTTPLNLAMMTGIGTLPKMARAATGAAFTLEQAAAIPEQVRRAVDTFKSPDATSGDKVQSVVEPLAQAGIGYLGARGAVHDFKTSPQVRGIMEPRINSDLNAGYDLAYDLGGNRASRNTGRDMVERMTEGTQGRFNEFGIVPTKLPEMGQPLSIPSEAPAPKLADQLKEGNDRTAKMLEEYDKFVNPEPPPSRDLPPRAPKSAEESAAVFTRNNPNAGTVNEQVQQWDRFRKTYGDAPSQNLPLPPRARAPKVEEVVSQGPSIEEQRLQDAAQRAGYDYETLTPQDRAALQELINTPDSTRYRKPEPEALPAPVEAAAIPPRQTKTPEQILADVQAANEKFRQEQIAKDVIPEAPPIEAVPELPSKLAAESAKVFERNNPNAADINEKVQAWDRFRKVYGEALPQGPKPPTRAFTKPKVEVVSEGPSIEEQRLMDAADRAGYDYKTLTPEDKAALSETINTVDPTRYKKPVDPRTKAARTLGFDPDNMSVLDNAILDGMLSQDAKARGEAISKYRRRAGQTGAWKPFANPGRQLTESEAHVAEMVAKREAARRAMKGGYSSSKSLMENARAIWASAAADRAELKSHLIDSLSPIDDTRSAVMKGDDSYSILPSQEFERAAADVYRAPQRAGVFAKRTGLVKAIQDLPEQLDLENADRLLLARRANEIDRWNVKNAEDLALANARYEDAKVNKNKAAAVSALKQIALLEDKKPIEVGRTPEEIAKDNILIDEFTPRYQPTLDAIKNHVTQLEDMMVESGLKSKGEIDNLRKMYPDYADFHRIMPEESSHFNNTRAVASKSTTNVIQKLVGSDKLEIDSPIENLLQKTHNVFREAAQNQAAMKAAELGKFPGGEKIVYEIPDRVAAKLDSQDYFTYLKAGKPVYVRAPREYVRAAKSLDMQSLDLLGKILMPAVRAFKVGTTGVNLVFTAANLARDQQTRFQNQMGVEGIAEKVNLSEQPKQTAKSLFSDTSSGPRVKTGGQSTASKIGDLTGIHTAIVKSTIDAIRDVGKNYVDKNSPGYDEMVWNSGGGNSFDMFRDQPLMSTRNIRAQKLNTLSNVFSDSSTLPNRNTAVTWSGESKGSKIKNALTGGWRELENLIGTTEDMTRLQAYNAAKRAALDAKMGEKEAQAVGGKAARQITADFYRGGNWKRHMMVLFPYANAGIQGTRSALRAAEKDPAGYAARVIQSMAIPVALATLHNISDPDRKKAYDDLQDWEKDKSLIWLADKPVRDSKGRYDGIKLPLAPGASEIGTLVRRNIEAEFGGDPVKTKEYALAMFNFLSPISGTGDQITGQMVPFVAKPVIEAVFNKDFYRGAPLQSDRSLKAPVAEQRYDSTSGTAQMLGEQLGVSPIKVDHVLKGYGGAVTPQVLHGIDVVRKDIADALPVKGNALDYLRALPVGGESTGESAMRRFVLAKGGATDQREMDATDEVARAVASEHAPEEKLAKEIFTLWKTDPASASKKFNESVGTPAMTEHTADLLEKYITAEQKGLTKAEQYLMHQPAEVRAERIIRMVKGKDAQQIIDMFKDMEDKKILTPAVLDAIEKRTIQ